MNGGVFIAAYPQHYDEYADRREWIVETSIGRIALDMPGAATEDDCAKFVRGETGALEGPFRWRRLP